MTALHLKRTLPRALGKNMERLFNTPSFDPTDCSHLFSLLWLLRNDLGPFRETTSKNNPQSMSLARQVEPLELVELLEPWVPLQLGENPTLGIYLSQDILHVSVCLYAFYQNPENYSTMANGIQ